MASGFTYYGYRYLDTQLGRWLSRDPIGEAGGRNVYAFLHNSAIGRLDYIGLRLVLKKESLPPSQMNQRGRSYGVTEGTTHGITTAPGLEGFEKDIIWVPPLFSTFSRGDCCCVRVEDPGEIVAFVNQFLPDSSAIDSTVTENGYRDVIEHEAKRLAVWEAADAKYFEGRYKTEVNFMSFICRKTFEDALFAAETIAASLYHEALGAFRSYTGKEQNAIGDENRKENLNFYLNIGPPASMGGSPVHRQLFDGFSKKYTPSLTPPGYGSSVKYKRIKGCNAYQ